MGGQYRPVVECSRYNWCSGGVTTSFLHHSFVYTLYICSLYVSVFVLGGDIVSSFWIEETERISTKFDVKAYAIQRNTGAVLFSIQDLL